MEKIKITSLGHSGEGIGTLNGLKVFVEGVLPEEEVDIEITARKKNYALAKCLKIITPSVERILPSCPVFGSCGGCQLMHLSYQGHLKAKKERVEAAFHRIARLPGVVVAEVIPSPATSHYRNKIQLPFFWDGKKMQVGLYRKNTHEIIPVSSCQIHCKIGEKVLAHVLELLPDRELPFRHLLIRSSLFSSESLVIFVTYRSAKKDLLPFAKKLLGSCSEVKGVLENINPKEGNTILGNDFVPILGEQAIYERVLGKTFKISAGAFFQVNTSVAEMIYLKAIEFANLNKEDCVIDAFCGSGPFALIAAPLVKKVIGIEVVPQAIQDAKENALNNNITNAEFYAGLAEKLLPQIKKADVIFLNPPRKGCEYSLLSCIAKMPIRSIVYISCDPATLARDVAILLPLGFELKKIQPFDLFPQTMHVETVVLLTKTYIST